MEKKKEKKKDLPLYMPPVSYILPLSPSLLFSLLFSSLSTPPYLTIFH